MSAARLTAALTALLLCLHAGTAAAQGAILDHFEDFDGWSAVSAPGAQVTFSRDAGYNGAGMRIDFDFESGGGYVLLRKDLRLSLPADYAFTFYLRGESPANNFEFKLVDASGQNVWWRNQRDYTFPTQWRRITVRKQQLEFAWGPAGGGHPKEISAIEIAVSRGSGGKGTIWIDDLRIEERESSQALAAAPLVTASSSTEGETPERVLDGDPRTRWRSDTHEDGQWLQLDFLRLREYGGMVIDWDHDDYATAYDVQVSNDGDAWETVESVTGGNGGRDYIYLPDAESRYLRLALRASARGQGYGIDSVEIKPYEFSASPNQFFRAIARDPPRGSFPRYFYDEQTYWTIIGNSGEERKGLLNEEGTLEVDRGAFTIEPFLHTHGGLITWNDVTRSQSLQQGYLPIPSVTWSAGYLSLEVTAFAGGGPGNSTLYGRYRLRNDGPESERVTLFLAVRPFQVNPPWQSLNMVGGVAPIEDIRYKDGSVVVNGDRVIVPIPQANAFGAMAFDQGLLTEHLREGRIPDSLYAHDPLGYASGAFAYILDLPPGGSREVFVAVPPGAALRGPEDEVGEPEAALLPQRLEKTAQDWTALLNHVEITVPAADPALLDTLRSNLAYILINRDGPALQPGPRCYARSWIRDGALTSAALLGMGYSDEVRDFIHWYARYQTMQGGIPCCIDRRGPDPVVENDSHGEFIYLIAEYYRYTHDAGLVKEIWPHVVRTVEYIDRLRQQRMTDEYKTAEKLPYYGLLPASISHEGYASRPVHSYWDDFWTLRGLKDAAELATAAGDAEHASSFAALRDAFRQDLYASLERTMSMHAIDYLPGSVELGDFDPTATTIAVAPGGEAAALPHAALERTFDIFYSYFSKRRNGEMDWGAYTPYEMRIPGTLIQLGHKDRAHELLDYFLADRRPAVWNEWPEILWRDGRLPRFFGDLPHTWVGSDYIRTVRSLFAYEREADQSLVIGAGITRDWAQGGVSVSGLPTYYGKLNYRLNRTAFDEVTLHLDGELKVPPGEIVFESPLDQPILSANINGRAAPGYDARSIRIGEVPADVVLHY